MVKGVNIRAENGSVRILVLSKFTSIRCIFVTIYEQPMCT
jgi:hypothetical protein